MIFTALLVFKQNPNTNMKSAKLNLFDVLNSEQEASTTYKGNVHIYIYISEKNL